MKKNSAGFTLIEIMLVVVLISVSAVTIVLNLPQSSQDEAKEEAQRFFYRLQLLNENAILNGKDYGIRIDESKNHYSYLTLEKDGWQELENKTFSRTELSQEIVTVLNLGSNVWLATEDSLFEQGSLFDEDMFAEFKEEQPVQSPQLFILSSGEITPFQLSFLPQESMASQPDKGWLVDVQESGVITLIKASEVNDKVGF